MKWRLTASCVHPGCVAGSTTTVYLTNQPTLSFRYEAGAPSDYCHETELHIFLKSSKIHNYDIQIVTQHAA
jgi:hypothetical protein